MSDNELSEYLDFAKGLAREAGEIMLKYFRNEAEHHYKEDSTIVTVADEEINQLVIDRVAEKFPDHSVLGEEASDKKASDYAWVCDPIDGTNPFAKGIPVSTFSLALAKNGRPVVGVINDPFTESLYCAALNKGAFLNDEPIEVSDKSLAPKTMINIDWWPDAEYEIDTPLHDLICETKTYAVKIGSVVRASSLVATGHFEAAIFAGSKGKNVDIAAAKVIVEEAGGKVTDLFGNEQRYDQDIKGAIISNGVCHEQIVACFEGKI